jgi:hypothetical protein
MIQTYYLAGPMRGYPQFNFPAFHRIAAALRAEGMNIISPAEVDEQHGIASHAVASDNGDEKVLPQSAGTILSRDVKVVLDDVDGIIFMNGWENSRGALLEATTGLISKRPMQFFAVQELSDVGIHLESLTPRQIRMGIQDGLHGLEVA